MRLPRLLSRSDRGGSEGDEQSASAASPGERLSEEAIEQQLAEAELPLADPQAQRLRTVAERFALGDEDLLGLLPASIPPVIEQQAGELTPRGTVRSEAIDRGAAFGLISLGIGLRLAEHLSDQPPRPIDQPGSSDGDPDALAATARDVSGNPVRWFLPGDEVWRELSKSACTTAEAATRAANDGFASAVPYERLFAFGYGVGCALDHHVPGWVEPIEARMATSDGQ